MAKQHKPKAGASSSRASPYPKKAKVEVKFDNSSKTSSNMPVSKAKSSVKSSTSNGSNGSAQRTAPVTIDKGKGKAKEVNEVSASVGDAASSSSGAGSSFIVIAGSYEKLLYGLEGIYSPGEENPVLKPIFIFPSHLACVKAIAASPGGKWLATGSEDEFIKVWDLRRRKEVGSLSQHQGSITSLHFPTSSHLITTSEDSTLSLFRTSDWALLKSLKGHSGRINHVDVHPTGRVALSVGKDKTLKMWDLMRGRGAASLALGQEAEMVKFSPRGTHFAVLYPKKVEIYSLQLQLLHTIETKSRYNTLLFDLLPMRDDDESEIDDEDTEAEEDVELLCIGTEKGTIEVYSVDVDSRGDGDDEDGEEDGKDESDGGEASSSEPKLQAEVDQIATLGGHANRVKSISSLPFILPATSSRPATPTILFTSVSSDGFIHLYDLTQIMTETAGSVDDIIHPLAKYDTKGSRLTCVCLAEGRKGINLAQEGAKTEVADDDLNDVSEDGASDEEGEDEDEDMYDQSESEGDEEINVELEEEDEEEYEEE